MNKARGGRERMGKGEKGEGREGEKGEKGERGNWVNCKGTKKKGKGKRKLKRGNG